MSYGIYKESYTGREAYRYRVVDGEDRLCYLAEPTGMFLPDPTRLVTFFNPDHEPIGRLEPAPRPSWQLSGTYSLLLESEEQPRAVIEEQWSLVDLILLRLPHYVLRIGTRTYVALGNRYGERLYELFLPAAGTIPELEEAELDDVGMAQALIMIAQERRGEQVGELTCPTRGPNYLVEAEPASLRQSPLALAGLIIIVDMHLSGVPL